jgi:autotransporter-associated beta strand protein
MPTEWSIPAGQTINTNGGTLVVKAPVSGDGFIKAGEGSLVFANSNTVAGPTSVTAGTLASSLTTGAPFGSAPISLSGGGILLFPPDGEATIASGPGSSLTFAAGGGMLQLGGLATCTVTIGGFTNGTTPNLYRADAGTLLIAPASGLAGLGSSQSVMIAGTDKNLPLVEGGMVAPCIMGQDNDSAASGGFLTYESGFVPAVTTSSATVGIGEVSPDAIYEVVNTQTVGGGDSATIAALEVDGGEIAGEGTLVVAGQPTEGVAGVIMNGGSISVGTLDFGANEGVIYVNDDANSITSVIQGSAGLTVLGPGELVLGGNNTTSLDGPITVNSGTLRLQSPYGSTTGAGPVWVRSGATLVLSGTVAGAVTIDQSATLSLANGAIHGPLVIDMIGQTSAEPGGILQGAGAVVGPAKVGGVIQCGPQVGMITFMDSATISSDTAFFWQLQGEYWQANSQPGIGWNALQFESADSTIGSSDEPVKIFLDFSKMGGDPDTANQAFWQNEMVWVIATFSLRPNGCWVAHGNFTYQAGCFCVSFNNGAVVLQWMPQATSPNWCTQTQ